MSERLQYTFPDLHGTPQANTDFLSLISLRDKGMCSESDLQDLYFDGMPMVVIAQNLGIPYETVQSAIFATSVSPVERVQRPEIAVHEEEEHSIVFSDPRMDREMSFDPEMIPLLNDYIHRWEMSFKDVIQETGINSTTLKAILTHMESQGDLVWDTRGQKEQFFEIDLSMFSSMSNKLAYFTGLMVTDGWIVSQKSGHKISSLAGVRLSADEQNEAVLQRYADELGMGLWYDKGNNSLVLSSRQKNFVTSIRGLGITEKKSYTVELPECINDDVYPAFMMGIIDGDGSVYPLEDGQFPLVIKISCGSELLMRQMERRNRKVFGIRKTNIHEEARYGKCKNGTDKSSLWTMRYYYAEAIRIFKKMEEAGLLDMGIQRKLPMAPNMILTEEEANEIAAKQYHGHIKQQVRHILRVAHPRAYRHHLRQTYTQLNSAHMVS